MYYVLYGPRRQGIKSGKTETGFFPQFSNSVTNTNKDHFYSRNNLCMDKLSKLSPLSSCIESLILQFLNNCKHWPKFEVPSN